ncbi:unnamed protein product, partial [marine sediment metagenome]
VYVDVEPGGYNPSAEDISDCITNKTRAIIWQHTYGICQPLNKLIACLSNRPITLIEDCCQVLNKIQSHFS